ncbi:MAG: ABC transporter permease [Methylohalobius sp.]|nr:ABC transporter permease [Methylohalobius sp.]
MTEFSQNPKLSVCLKGDCLLLSLGGDWLLSSSRPNIEEVDLALNNPPKRLIVEGERLGAWDSSLILFLYQLHKRCLQADIALEWGAIPEGVKRLLALATAVPAQAKPANAQPSFLERIGTKFLELGQETYEFIRFIGEATLTLLRFVRGQAHYRRQDLWWLLEECGPSALPIVTLIALLVGLILAYVGAGQLSPFGAQIYVANLVGLGMVREMGAMMTAVIMAGRTGAAYAAQLGTMQVNEEIDALKTLGLEPIEFLILPRMLALCLMVPLLTAYADLVGLLGGALAAVSLFDLTLLEYLHQTRTSLALHDGMVGLIKAAVFGVLIATSGCLRGIQCQRSAQSVGEAATSAVVTGVVAIVVADALLTVLFTRLGL